MRRQVFFHFQIPDIRILFFDLVQQGGAELDMDGFVAQRVLNLFGDAWDLVRHRQQHGKTGKEERAFADDPIDIGGDE